MDDTMKLIGNYISPYVRKISVMLLEKGITFELLTTTRGWHRALHQTTIRWEKFQRSLMTMVNTGSILR